MDSKQDTTLEDKPLIVLTVNQTLEDTDPGDILATLADAFLTHRHQVKELSYKPLAFEMIKIGFSLSVAIANTILFYEVSNAFAKNYLHLGNAGQASFFFSSSYANFFLSLYTSLELLQLPIQQYDMQKIMQTIPSLQDTGKNVRFRRFAVITGVSLITSIPTVAPLSDTIEQALTFFSNVLMYMYALYEMHDMRTQDQELKDYFNSIRVGILSSEEISAKLGIQNGSQFLDVLSTYHQAGEKKYVSPEFLSKYATAYAIFSAVSVVTPFFLVMMSSMNNTHGDNGFLKYLVSYNPLTRLVIAILTSFITNIVFFILSGYFGYNTVFSFHDMFFGNKGIGKQEYPLAWGMFKIFQAVMTSLSWSTGTKLFLDFFDGPKFRGYSQSDELLLYITCAFIALGIYSFNLYSNLQLVDLCLEKAIALWGGEKSKQKLQLLDTVDQFESTIKSLKTYHQSSYNRVLPTLFKPHRAEVNSDCQNASLAPA